jgi:hypothetical protein
MKIDSISMFRHLVFALLVCTVSSLRGQTLYALKIDRNIRLEAQGITARYQPRLVMGVDQALEFQSTVARFLVKKRAVEQDENLSPKAKYVLLKRLSSRETSEMADVLESYRWQEYMRIKAQIQPIPEPRDLKENFVVQE